MSLLFFFNDTATTEIYTLSLHDALPILLDRTSPLGPGLCDRGCPGGGRYRPRRASPEAARLRALPRQSRVRADRKSTRLNSSHANISYAVFCLKKKK